MSGFFLNQKSVFLFFLFTAESGSLSHTRGGTKPGHYCACLVGAPLSCLPCRISTASSCALQVFGHSCLCLSCLFGADCSEGSCLLFSDWPKWLCWMFFYSPNNWTVLNHSPSAWVTRTALFGCRQRLPMEPAATRGSTGPGYSLPGISKGVPTGVVEGGHLDLRHPHKRCFSNQKPFTWLTFQ